MTDVRLFTCECICFNEGCDIIEEFTIQFPFFPFIGLKFGRNDWRYTIEDCYWEPDTEVFSLDLVRQ